MSLEKASQHDPTEKRASPTEDVETVPSPGPPNAISDVVLADSETGKAPTFRGPEPTPAPAAAKQSARSDKPMGLLPGAKVDDFEIVRMLGKGAFGHVYLARQLSLDRHVALKVSANRGSEGRTMARLEHQHIVQVFSEMVERDFNQRLLCMQLVPGIGLEKLIGALHVRPHGGSGNQPIEDWYGSELLQIIDRASSMPAELDPSALHDREALSRMDSVEATAWYGARLAEALDFAHRHGVLHRDIKPANILVNSYGQPLLADFNISSQPVGSAGGEDVFGGTFAYMSPEHLDAFNPAEKEIGPEAVTARSDLYSLAIVLRQLLSGGIGFALPNRKASMVDSLRKLAHERRQPQPECSAGSPCARQTLERTICRCLSPRPEDRFASGAALAEQLDGCRRLRQAERQLPPIAPIWAPALRRPFLWLVTLVVLPQLLGSIVNITYNMKQIGTVLTGPQQRLFDRVVIGYNAIMYPAAVALFVLALRPVWRCWRALERSEPLAEGQVEAARKRALHVPVWVAILTVWGWFPGGILFPLVLAVGTPPLELQVAAHFFVSFFLSGLIALAYSLCGAQFIVLRVFYPAMWRDVRSFDDTARSELAPMSKRFGYIQFLAISIPLLAALLLLALVREGSTDTLRWVVFGLIVLGMIGSHVTHAVIRHLTQVVVALTNTKD